MAGKFGILSTFEFLQDWASALIAGINPALVHNVEKYYALKKVHYLSAIEDVEGDYLEFGVFTGSSFCHSIRCCRRLTALNTRITQTRFVGFDSFRGFGTLADEDKHPFYTDETFETSLLQVERRVRRVAGTMAYRLVPGFFSDTLAVAPSHYGIHRSRIIFVDSDTYTSARDALTFCLPTVQEGTFVILDDYYAYRGSEDRGVAKAFAEFAARGALTVRQVFTYGMGGAVYIVSAKRG